LGRSGDDKDAEDYDELVIKGTENKLETSLLSSDLEFYMPAMSPTPRTRPFTDDTSQGQGQGPAGDGASRPAAKNARRADHKNADMAARNQVVGLECA